MLSVECVESDFGLRRSEKRRFGKSLLGFGGMKGEMTRGGGLLLED